MHGSRYRRRRPFDPITDCSTPPCGPMEHVHKGVTMAKKDIAVTISAADHLLETTTDPLHRQIGGFLALEDTSGIDAGEAVRLRC